MRFRSPYANLVLVVETASMGPPIRPGKRIKFQNGVYETSAKDEIAFIKKHPGFGAYIFADEPQVTDDAKG